MLVDNKCEVLGEAIRGKTELTVCMDFRPPSAVYSARIRPIAHLAMLPMTQFFSTLLYQFLPINSPLCVVSNYGY